VVSQLKLIKSKKSYLVTMPARRRSDGRYHDIVYPVTAEMRKILEEKVLAAYEKITGEPLERRVLK